MLKTSKLTLRQYKLRQERFNLVLEAKLVHILDREQKLLALAEATLMKALGFKPN